MTSKEALSNLGEMIKDNESEEEVRHLFELANKIVDEEIPFEEWETEERMGILEDLDEAFGQED